MSKPLKLIYRRRLWQTLRTVEAVAAGQVPNAVFDQGTFGYVVRDQSGKACGTACCFAGWAAQNAGIPMARTPPFTKDGVHVMDWATAHLGLTGDQADMMFTPVNTLDDLRRLVREFAGPEPKAGRR